MDKWNSKWTDRLVNGMDKWNSKWTDRLAGLVNNQYIDRGADELNSID